MKIQKPFRVEFLENQEANRSVYGLELNIEAILVLSLVLSLAEKSGATFSGPKNKNLNIVHLEFFFVEEHLRKCKSQRLRNHQKMRTFSLTEIQSLDYKLCR